LQLMDESICTIDQRREGDSEQLQISNFFAREDRETHEIVVHCSPLNRTPAFDEKGQQLRVNWTADAWLYRIRVAQSR